ncbi:hypothetical protein AB0F88_39845 [Streptosporangium sp. NPDC023963]|uniref:hypothetical protein n=1 Tax=Streptosporangium sp. NPDC023963 TaxID=3155608 RepID=UPI00341400AA
MARRRLPQDYTAGEFDAVVAQIQGNPRLRADLETIAGYSLEGRPPRELFDAFRAMEGATDVMAAVVRYGQGVQAVRRTRVEMEFDPEVDLTPQQAEHVAELQAKLDAERREKAELKAALKVAQSPRHLVQLPADHITRKAVGE